MQFFKVAQRPHPCRLRATQGSYGAQKRASDGPLPFGENTFRIWKVLVQVTDYSTLNTIQGTVINSLQTFVMLYFSKQKHPRPA